MENSFRDYREDDYKDILKLVAEELTAAGEKLEVAEVERLFREHLDPGRDTIRIMISEKGKLIGWYRYGPWPRGEQDPGKTAHLFDIALKKKFRGVGLGKVLYDHFENEVQAAGYQKIYSRTLSANQGARAFHDRMGFSVWRREGANILWVKGLVPGEELADDQETENETA